MPVIYRTSKWLAGSAIGGAVAASICCFGPLLLALLGVGGGALLLKFEPYRPYFLVTTGLILAGAFYGIYRKAPLERCEPGTACANPASRKTQEILLWIAAAIVLILATFPYYSKYVF